MKPVASYLFRVHLRPAEDEEAVIEPPTIADVERVVREAISESTRAEVSVKAERIDE